MLQKRIWWIAQQQSLRARVTNHPLSSWPSLRRPWHAEVILRYHLLVTQLATAVAMWRHSAWRAPRMMPAAMYWRHRLRPTVLSPSIRTDLTLVHTLAAAGVAS